MRWCGAALVCVFCKLVMSNAFGSFVCGCVNVFIWMCVCDYSVPRMCRIYAGFMACIILMRLWQRCGWWLSYKKHASEMLFTGGFSGVLGWWCDVNNLMVFFVVVAILKNVTRYAEYILYVVVVNFSQYAVFSTCFPMAIGRAFGEISHSPIIQITESHTWNMIWTRVWTDERMVMMVAGREMCQPKNNATVSTTETKQR